MNALMNGIDLVCTHASEFNQYTGCRNRVSSHVNKHTNIQPLVHADMYNCMYLVTLVLIEVIVCKICR